MPRAAASVHVSLRNLPSSCYCEGNWTLLASSLLAELLEKERVEAGTVDLHMTQSAGLILGRLVVERRDGRRVPVGDWRVALQTQDVDRADAQLARVHRAMRRMAAAASDLLDRYVLEDKRALLVEVALVAHLHAAVGLPQLPVAESAVRVVAVRALDQAHVYAMPEGAGELRLLLRVAAVTQLRLRLQQQPLRSSGVVRRVAAEAADSLRKMDRLGKIAVFYIGLMTTHAAAAGLRRRQLAKTNDLRLVSAALYVRAARTMAVLAAVMAILGQSGVRSVG